MIWVTCRLYLIAMDQAVRGKDQNRPMLRIGAHANRLAGIVAACLLLADCTGLDSVYSDMKYRFRDVSLTDRCIYFAQQAFPELRLAAPKIQSSTGINATTARIEGVNENASSTGSLARDVAVECHFQNGILTDFHWTAGPFR